MISSKTIRKILPVFFMILGNLAGGSFLFSLFDPLNSLNSTAIDPRVIKLSNIIQILNERIKGSLSDDERIANTQRRDYFAGQATKLAMPTINPTVLMNAKETGIAEATKAVRTSTQYPTETRATGLFLGVGYVKGLSEEAKLSKTYLIGNRNGEYITVLVGNLRDDLSQGVIYIYSPMEKGWEKFLCPGEVGALQLIGEIGSELKISDDSGKIISFNIQTESYGNVLGTPIPTILPSPTEMDEIGTPYPEP